MKAKTHGHHDRGSRASEPPHASGAVALREHGYQVRLKVRVFDPALIPRPSGRALLTGGARGSSLRQSGIYA